MNLYSGLTGTPTVGYDPHKEAPIGNLPPGVTARQLLAQVSREIQEEKDAAKAAFEAKEEAARLAKKAIYDAAKAEVDAATQEYLALRKQMLPILQRLWRAQGELGPLSGLHPHIWRITLPSLHPDDPNNPAFSTFEVIHHARGELQPW
jgi:hypothetical protein